MATKIQQIQSMLERRIRHGDYLLTTLPAERELCEETGASRMTARKAIERLVAKGLIERLPNHRLAVPRNIDTFAFLTPSISSGNMEQWRLAIETAVHDLNGCVRTVLYVHWDDPVLLDAIESFNNIFLYPSSEQIPDRIIARLKDVGRSLIILEHDLTAHGITSLCPFPACFTQRLLDILGELGYRNIDCFNIQPVDTVIADRIEQWNVWRATHGIDGKLHNEPSLPYTPYEAQLKWAYDNMGKILDQKAFKASALLCTTVIAAIGAIRAMLDRGIKVGDDVSVCAINDEGLARYLYPSLTSVQMPDPIPYIRMCIEQMQSTDKSWVGSRLIQPSRPELFIGESTSKAKK